MIKRQGRESSLRCRTAAEVNCDSVIAVENIQETFGFRGEGGSEAPPVASIMLIPPANRSINHRQNRSAAVLWTRQFPQ
jgi:hypothetical protein